MNLVTDPWIPVLTAEGKPALASLMQALTEGEHYRDLAVRPHERIALMRLLICIAQAALDGPQDYYSREAEIAGLPAAANAYLVAHQDAFNLFDEQRPFLQVSWAPLVSPSPRSAVSKMDCTLAANNNSTLFDHQGSRQEQRVFSDPQLALMLVTFQCFAQGGGKSSSIWRKQPKNFTDGPCKPSSMLHTFVREASLQGSICANVLTRETVKRQFGGVLEWGSPVWECPAKTADDPLATRSATETYLGRLCPLARFVRLYSGQGHMLLESGLEYPKFAREPTATEVPDKDGKTRRLLSAGSKATWRELSALTTHDKRELPGGALALDYVPLERSYDVWVGALVSNPKQAAEVVNLVESVLHVPAGMQTDLGRREYEAGVGEAERSAYRLQRAVEAYRSAVDAGWGPRLKFSKDKFTLRSNLHVRATHHFWTSIEVDRHLLIDRVRSINTDDLFRLQGIWRSHLNRNARDAYDLACGKETPRQIRAYAIGYAVLFPSPKASIPAPQPSPAVHEEEEA